MTWTDDSIARLKALHAGGLSARQIMDEINSEFRAGVSRSAIIGKLHRLGLTGGGMRRTAPSRQPRPKPPALDFRRKPLPAQNPGPAEKQPAPPAQRDERPLRAAPVQPLHKQLVELQRGDCRYPYGDSAPFTFCGHPAQGEDEPYCREHSKLCFNGIPGRRSVSARAA